MSVVKLDGLRRVPVVLRTGYQSLYRGGIADGAGERRNVPGVVWFDNSAISSHTVAANFGV